jgi:hypothetical protein
MIDERLHATPETPENKYALSPEVMKDRIATLLLERPPITDKNEVCYRLEGDDPYADIARTTECGVFDASFGNDPEKMEEEYGPYEKQSSFKLTIDRETKEPTGTLRVIRNGPAGLKTLNDITKYFVNRGIIDEEGEVDLLEAIKKYHGIEDLEGCLDVGTVAVPPKYRIDQGSLTSVKLYRAMYVDAMTSGTKHFVSMIDLKAHRILTQHLGIPFEPLAGLSAIEYLGSDKTYPVYGEADEFLKSANRKKKETEARMGGRASFELLERAFGILVDGKDDDSYQFAINNETLKLE